MKPRSEGEIMGEIAYLDFVLRQRFAQLEKPRSPIERMIDEACGAEQLHPHEVKKIIKRIKKLEGMLGEYTYWLATPQ
jgi:hypothetical protein